jgi:hypothetical protein
MKLNERKGRASEETRPVAGGETGKALTAKKSLQLKPGPVKRKMPRQKALSPLDIFLEYRRVLTKGLKNAVKAEKMDSPEMEEKERWAALLTLCRMFKWQPKDLGIVYFGNKILGPTVKTEKILIRLVLWLIKNQLDELMKAA